MTKIGSLSANKLFDRKPQAAYLEEWEKFLSQPIEPQIKVNEFPMVVFRLGSEWFGLSALIFSEITMQRTINSIPYRNNPLLLGVVNLRGQLRLCFSMDALLGIEKIEQPADKKSYYPRLLAIMDENEIWTFPVDEVDSVYSMDLSKVANVPANVSQSRDNYLTGLININDKKIYIIDAELIFMSLRRRLL